MGNIEFRVNHMRLNKHRSKFKYIILILLAVFLLSNRGFRALIKNSLEYRRLRRQKAELDSEKIRLETGLKAIKEPGQIEETARKDLGLIRPDEIEYRFPPPGNDD
jgi:cell division protein FtsB